MVPTSRSASSRMARGGLAGLGFSKKSRRRRGGRGSARPQRKGLGRGLPAVCLSLITGGRMHVSLCAFASSVRGVECLLCGCGGESVATDSPRCASGRSATGVCRGVAPPWSTACARMPHSIQALKNDQAKKTMHQAQTRIQSLIRVLVRACCLTQAHHVIQACVGSWLVNVA